MFFARIILAILLVVPGLSSASRAIFYQPQLRDLDVRPENWPTIFQAVRNQGIDTLIVQWTSYGDVLDKNATQQWLKSRLEDAIAAGLNLVIGLHADPELFIRLEQPTKVLGDYFRKQRQLDTVRARYWLGVLPGNKISGWYMPLEIDDRRWREQNAFAVLNEHIQSEAKALQAIGDKAVFVSSFFAGNMAPQQYAEMLSRLKKDSPIQILVQDGRGTGKLSPRERELYLDTLSQCNEPIADGIVFEIFRQTRHDKEFQAQPLPKNQRDEVLKMRAPCNKETVLFSLRYLIDLQQPTRE
ncbi:MAG: DUF4434 domain-containing protein [Sheuella sp.]|nr:DUF4434 domain-containing protein [Sheuella sp.]